MPQASRKALRKAQPDYLIDALGGTCAVAKAFGVAPSSVSLWRIKGIPQARLQALRAAADPGLMPIPSDRIRQALRLAGYED